MSDEKGSLANSIRGLGPLRRRKSSATWITPPAAVTMSRVSTQTPTLRVLRVFCDAHGRAGNPLGVFLDDPPVPKAARQATAARLGFSETVFFDDVSRGTLEIFTPTRELSFAGHPLVGAAWLLVNRGGPPTVLRPTAGAVPFAGQAGGASIQARAKDSPEWLHLQLPDPASVEALAGPPENLGHVQVWAWQDERRGHVRARVFASDYGVPEDPATGSAAIALCTKVERELLVIQGLRGAESEIMVCPLDNNLIKLSGRVVEDRRH
jgi:predicted PhzF superfamily epimerase YddE/YHI9